MNLPGRNFWRNYFFRCWGLFHRYFDLFNHLSFRCMVQHNNLFYLTEQILEEDTWTWNFCGLSYDLEAFWKLFCLKNPLTFKLNISFFRLIVSHETLMIIWITLALASLKLYKGRSMSDNSCNWVTMILLPFLDVILKFAAVSEALCYLIME